MAKKHWIYLKRGLSEDPKHREEIGNAIWAFLHIIDRADWEKGIVYDWRDKDEAADMAVNERTLRDWRQRLEQTGKIKCIQRQHSLDIMIYNWINPRDYSGGILNPRAKTDESQGDKKSAPLEFQGDTQGDTEGDTQGRRKCVTPTSSSDSSTSSQTGAGGKTIFQFYEECIGPLTQFIADELKDSEKTYPRLWIEDALKECVLQNKRNWKYAAAILKRWKEQGRDNGNGHRPRTPLPPPTVEDRPMVTPEMIAKARGEVK